MNPQDVPLFRKARQVPIDPMRLCVALSDTAKNTPDSFLCFANDDGIFNLVTMNDQGRRVDYLIKAGHVCLGIMLDREKTMLGLCTLPEWEDLGLTSWARRLMFEASEAMRQYPRDLGIPVTILAGGAAASFLEKEEEKPEKPEPLITDDERLSLLKMFSTPDTRTIL